MKVSNLKNILIIEDEATIANLERDYLEANGFSVDISGTGDDGLYQAMTGNYDLIILDLMLPAIDGFEICKKIRNTKNIPIIMVSAKKEDVDKIRGLGIGADDYVVKPFSPSELVARVKAHISRYSRLTNHAEPSDELYIDGIRIDKRSRRVFVHEQEVIFTSKEFNLLYFLAVNPNQVFSKEDLFERIWGLDSMGDVGTVFVHIRKIREKIETDPSKPKFIETIWGAGYRFKA